MNREQRRMLAKQDLFQCEVTTKEGTQLLVGPRSNLRGIPEAIAEGINKRVAEGKGYDWHDAHVVPIKTITH